MKSSSNRCGDNGTSNGSSNGSSPKSGAHDHTEANNLASLWLIIWTCNNIGITLLNKAAFATVDFRYPYFLSAVHMALNALGAQFVFWRLERHNHDEADVNSKARPSLFQEGDESWISKLFGNLQRKSLDQDGKRLIMAFSIVFSSNIAIGNVSLQHVSVNFNQVMRSLVPAITIAMGSALGRPTSFRRQLSVIPVIVGVAMACFGDMSYTALGFTYTVLCICLAAFKVVASGELLTGSLKLHPFDLLAHMAPLAFAQCMVLSILTGEVHSIAARWPTELNPMVNIYPFTVVMMSGVLSFTFNISSLQTNKLTSPLTLCIAGNVKQVLMIVIATVVFRTEISPLNAGGIVVVLAGSALYSYVSLMEQTAGKAPPLEEATMDMDNDDKENGATDDQTSEMTNLVPSPTNRRGVSRAASAPISGRNQRFVAASS
ncbi:hypothetical protein ACA910_005639 [Epithemia clementina (nom. ined.)]